LDEVTDISKVQGDPITMDLGFHVPTNLVPVLLEFKRDNVVQVSAPASPEDAPQPVPFGVPAPPPAAAGDEPAAPQAAQPSAAEPDSQQRPTPQPAAKSPKGSKGRKQGKGLSDISRSVVGGQVPEN
jgi:hypothetical protein